MLMQEKVSLPHNTVSIRTVRLYGKLGTKFGRVHRLAVESPAEAIRALCVTVKGFEKYLKDGEKNGFRFAVFNGKENIGEEQLPFKGQNDIRIAPVITGSKRGGVLQVIVGAVLIAAAVFTGGASLVLAKGLMGAGISLVAGGLMQMLSPQPKGAKTREPTENAASYAFGGAVNTTARGNPIGILAGERIIGGAVISASVSAEDI